MFKDLNLDITKIKHKLNMHITSTKLGHGKHKEQENIKTGKHKLDENFSYVKNQVALGTPDNLTLHVKKLLHTKLRL